MSPRQVFAPILHLFILFSFFTGAFFFLAFPYLPHLKEKFFEKSPWIGLGLLIASLILLLGFYLLHRGKYLILRGGVSVDLHVVRQTIEDCLSRQFPKISCRDVELGTKSRIEIRISLKLERKEELLQVEKQLGRLLQERFGYLKPFYLIVKV